MHSGKKIKRTISSVKCAYTSAALWVYYGNGDRRACSFFNQFPSHHPPKGAAGAAAVRFTVPQRPFPLYRVISHIRECDTVHVLYIFVYSTILPTYRTLFCISYARFVRVLRCAVPPTKVGFDFFPSHVSIHMNVKVYSDSFSFAFGSLSCIICVDK